MDRRRLQVRDLLVRIATTHRRLRHEESGFLNESQMARELGLRASTVHRLLRPEDLTHPDAPYQPGATLLRGLMPLTGCRSPGEVLDFIDETDSASERLLKLRIRPEPGRARSFRH